MPISKDIFIAGTGTWLPATSHSVAEAIEAGLVGEEHQNLGFESVLVDESGTAAADMAVAAGRKAVQRSGIPPEEFGLSLHGTLWFQGLDYWMPGHYIAQNTVGPQAVPFSLDQRSCSGLGAIHLAAAYLSCGLTTAALVTTSDKYSPPNIDRWNSQLQVIYGDGGTALVLSTKGGFARLLSTVELSDNSLEGWTRGTEPFYDLPGQEIPVKVLKRAQQQAASPGAEEQWKRWVAAIVATKERALSEAGVEHGEIARVCTPFAHRGGGQTELHDLLGYPVEMTLWNEIGRRYGHLGGGDQITGLNHLIEQRAVSPGDRVLLFGLGMGFTFSAAVVEILDVPTW